MMLPLAELTQEQVFRSIEDNVNQSADTGKLLAVLLAIAGLVVLLIAINQRRKREETPRTLNHPGKLLKEVSRSVGLKSAEVRRLSALAEELGEKRGEPLVSPLTLLLCPSLMEKAMRQRKG